MKHELWTSGNCVSLEEILNARENRVKIQQKMLQKAPTCLLSFTLNIPGSVKVFPYTKWLMKWVLLLFQKVFHF